MRVLHLTAGNMYGGVETLQVTLARYRHLNPDMEPEFGLCFRGRLWDELQTTGVPVHDFGAVRLSRPWTVRAARNRLRALLARTRFDAAISHSSWPHAVFAPVIRRAGIHLAYIVHGEVSRGHWLDRWASWTRPDVIIPNSRFIARSAERVFRCCPLELVYYPVVGPALAELSGLRKAVRAEMGVDDHKAIIFQASRLEPWKGQVLHLKALGRLKDLPGWEAWFAGGPQKRGEMEFLGRLQTLAAELGIPDRVRFLGQRSDVQRLMAAVDIFCQPNLGPEPFGIVYIEALYNGLPVVATNFGGAAEIVTPECGVLTAPGDDAAVATALADLVRDPQRRRALGAGGPTRARELCDPMTQLSRLRAILTSDVSGRAQGVNDKFTQEGSVPADSVLMSRRL